VHSAGTTRNLDAVIETMVSGRDLQLTGKSGGGKTLLMKHLALKVLEMGRSPMILSTIDYSGKLSTLLDRGIAHMYPQTGMHLLQSAGRSNSPLVLILQRKQFDLLVPGHPGLGMRPTGGLISANMIFHQQQGQLQ
jgi:hypothetical protein